jgi:phosphoribosylanthranilate isomerase
VQDIVRTCRLDYVQLCGDESPEYCKAVGYPVIKVAKVPPSGIVPDMSAYKVDYLLLDTFIAGSHGGTGKTFAWQEARKAIKEGMGAPIIVAGGLTPKNVAQAIIEARPQGVDVSGGVETDGVKDIDKIAGFIKAAQETSTMLWRRDKGKDENNA